MAPGSLTREVFGNIDGSSKLVFYLLAAVSLTIFTLGIRSRVRLWRAGQPNSEKTGWPTVVRRLFSRVLFQRSTWSSRRVASCAHLLVFSGMLVLTLGTILIAIEHLGASLAGRSPTDPLFHKGLYFAIYELLMDAFGVALLLGSGWFLARRMGWGNKQGSESIAGNRGDIWLLASLMMLAASGYLVEGLRILWAETGQPGFSPVGLLAAWLFTAAGTTSTSAAAIHLVLWWCHAVAALAFIAVIPYTRLLHAIAGAIQLATQQKQLGQMQLVSIEDLEKTGRFGVGQLADFQSRQLRELDACVACGRCQDVCPAHQAGKPLSPRDLVQGLRGELDNWNPTAPAAGGSLHAETVSAETLWSCTTCSACVDICPLGVNPLEMITDLRRYLVGEGQLRGPPAATMQKLQRSGNPWGLPSEDRLAWARDLDVPTAEANPDFDVLYWVGCAAAYDRRTQRVARSVIRLLQAASVNFAIPGSQARCTGESARRMGDEFLFQELAAANVEMLDSQGLSTSAPDRDRLIITHCPHCLNSLLNDYPQVGGNYQVLHHSEYLLDLVQQGQLQIEPAQLPEMTYHDPCYLARVGEVVSAPRQLLEIASGKPPREMPRHGINTSCCGAGGGRMWMDDDVDSRIGGERVTEALETGASVVAVGCPFCLTMMGDGIAARDQNVVVKDIAELLVDALDLESNVMVE
jgi:Fe-S oxidoreductase/nitrate reductase gamma subunit